LRDASSRFDVCTQNAFCSHDEPLRMDLLDVRGVGPATKEKLALAGIRTVDDLARVRDVNVVADWSGVPAARVEALVAAAREANTPRPPAVALRSAWGAAARLGRTVVSTFSFRSARSS
jgi:predicted RecB family nuclease